MRASLFVLFLRRTNLMDLYFGFVQLVLSHLLYLMPFCLLMYVCAHDMVFNTCFSGWKYQYTRVRMCMPLGTHFITRWVTFWLPYACMFRCWSLRPWWWSEWHSGSIVDQRLTIQRFFPPAPPAWLSSFLFEIREHLSYCSYLYIFCKFLLLHLSEM